MATPLSVKRIYGESLTLWRANFLRLTILALCLEVPIILAELILHLGTGITISTEELIPVSVASPVLAIYGSLSHHFLSGLLEKLVGSERHGHLNPPLRVVLHELPWARLFIGDLVLTALVVLGAAAFVVPGILIATWLTPMLVIVNLEGRTVRDAMRRSYELVRGHFWRVFLVGFIALAAVQLVVNSISAAMHHYTDVHTLNVLAHAVPATLLMPIGALPIVVLTFDLVSIHASRAARRPSDDGAALRAADHAVDP